MIKRLLKKLFPGVKTIFFVGIIVGIVFLLLGSKAVKYTSTDKFCQKCHVHPHAEISWKQSTHVSNKSGVQVHCVECHLPPEGWPYLREKTKTGLRDAWATMFSDTKKINWDEKSKLEHAVKIVYKESCIRCHQNLFTKGLKKEGEDAHLYYTQHEKELHCINCHLGVGHYDPTTIHQQNTAFGTTESGVKEYFNAPTKIEKFSNFTEKIPGTSVSFDMVAIPGGTFKMGSPENEPFRRKDEGPVHTVKLSPFFIGKVEVSWDEFMAFYKATASEGRLDPAMVMERNQKALTVDAISGPTAPYGYPDQGWGKGKRPAITMSFNAAETYVKWLSMITGKKYRLPTEAEWEYAVRGGKDAPYFFEGSPKKYSSQGFWKKIFGPDTAVIARYVVYKLNSSSKTQEPVVVRPNPFGVENMLGNVREFCSDWYAADSYAKSGSITTDPKGPAYGSEHVVRGGSFKSDAQDVRAAARDFTRTDAWLKTDPQMPKSIWWYSDVIDVGFRVVCEPDSSILNTK